MLLLPCENQNTKNVILQQEIKTASNVSKLYQSGPV